MRRFARTSWSILTAGALALTAAWPVASGAQPYSEWVHYRRLDVPAPWGTQRVLVTFPRRGDRLEHPPGQRYPVLIALHGRGESRDAERAHLGWANLYRLPDAFAALLRGRVSVADYNRFVRDTHLAYVNASLRARPFVGVMVVTPYVPDVSGEPLGSERMRALGAWLSGPLLDAVRERFEGAARTREGTGIDGVSMGGRVALEVGLGHPQVFGAVGAIQPAIRGTEEALADLAAAGAREAPQHLRLLTSEEDPFLWPTRRLSMALGERRVAHTLTVMPGPHDYAFNRGPGG
ncbi:MAG TPA: alpha/beta hydrolase-fold protein, partial [Sandaracinaceae bacterium]